MIQINNKGNIELKFKNLNILFKGYNSSNFYWEPDYIYLWAKDWSFKISFHPGRLSVFVNHDSYDDMFNLPSIGINFLKNSRSIDWIGVPGEFYNIPTLYSPTLDSFKEEFKV